MADSTLLDLGVNLLETEIDDVIFKTNEFVTNSTFTGHQGPFWWIIQISMALGALFSLCIIANMGYKMMYKNEPPDIMKLFKPLAICLVMYWWYPPNGRDWSFLDFFSYIPNAIGSYTCALYEAESIIVHHKFGEIQYLLYERDSITNSYVGDASMAANVVTDPNTSESLMNHYGTEKLGEVESDAKKTFIKSITTGAVVALDKIIMVIALITYRIGWWSTIYVQQIMLGMLTIFGPIQWAFSLLPKWESNWAKWITRYLTVHFFGAMLYFVGFYVLLLFDIVLTIQLENLKAMNYSPTEAFFSAGYLMAASVVSLKCLNLVPDLASWMIPEGEAAFSTRNFGEGVGSQIGSYAKQVGGKLIG